MSQGGKLYHMKTKKLCSLTLNEFSITTTQQYLKYNILGSANYTNTFWACRRYVATSVLVGSLHNKQQCIAPAALTPAL